jgi:formamidopyrimidine-DNA glycosylase
MPELPEVEIVKKGLERSVLNQTILNVQILNSKMVASNSNKRDYDLKKESEFISGVKGKKIINVWRKAKNIIIELEDKSIILIHLKMTGQMIYILNSSAEKIEADLKHTHVVFKLEHGELSYNDVRRFGYVLYYESLAGAYGAGHFHNLGHDPFDPIFTLEYLTSKLKYKNKSIKKTFLDQDIVVGVGNIYADEICFASLVLPMRICSTLQSSEISLIYHNIISILGEAIRLGGSSISDYKNVNGEKGKFALRHQVYGRVGLACKNCNNILIKTMISGRSTVYCDKCQL